MGLASSLHSSKAQGEPVHEFAQNVPTKTKVLCFASNDLEMVSNSRPQIFNSSWGIDSWNVSWPHFFATIECTCVCKDKDNTLWFLRREKTQGHAILKNLISCGNRASEPVPWALKTCVLRNPQKNCIYISQEAFISDQQHQVGVSKP